MRWSIIVCTHNRAAYLKKNLPHLDALEYPRSEYEIIVVDNASTDDTPAVVKEVGCGIIYIFEQTPGLSHARNRGIESAKGELVAFIDDDAWPDQDWLQQLEKGFVDKKVACVGGKVLPDWEAGRVSWPDWVHPLLVAQYSITGYGEIERSTTYPNIPAGTNIAFRKCVLSSIGGFRPDLGRLGSCLISGEEGEMCLRVQQAGYLIVYLPYAVVHHLIPEQRLTQEWLLSRCYWQGISSAIVERSVFTKKTLLFRTMRFAVLLVAALLATPVLVLISPKLRFFCRCQKALWRAYLLEMLRRTGNATS